jgi:hypothetical protein
MNSYTVEFKYHKWTVEASDTDHAVMIAAVCADEIVDVEDRGELYTVTLHRDNGDDLVTFSAEKLADLMEIPVKLPSRRQAGLTLSYDSGDLFVTSFAYSASLSCASNEGELQYCGDGLEREPKILNARQQEVVDNWAEREADYYATNGWATWSEVNE